MKRQRPFHVRDKSGRPITPVVGKVYAIQPVKEAYQAPKPSPLSNEPIRTGGFGGVLNKRGYGGGRQ